MSFDERDPFDISPDIAALSPDQLEARLESYRRGPLAVNWTRADLRQAHGEILAAMSGCHLGADIHPLTEKALRDGGAPSILGLARDYCTAMHGAEANRWDDRAILAQAVSTGHLADALADVANNAILDRAPRLLGKLLAITRPVELRDFRAANVSAVELDAELPSPQILEGQMWQKVTATSAAEDLQLATVPLRLRFSEQLAVNDNVDALARTVEAAQIASAQNELTTCFDILTTNGNLSDGSALFDAAFGNLISGQSKAASALNNAADALRSQQVNGKNCDADPRILLVPSSDEATARALVRDASIDAGWMRVIGTSYVSSEWYMFSDPRDWCIVARGTLRGSDGQSLRFSAGAANAKESIRDVILEGMHSVDYAAIGRIGCVRVEFA